MRHYWENNLILTTLKTKVNDTAILSGRYLYRLSKYCTTTECLFQLLEAQMSSVIHRDAANDVNLMISILLQSRTFFYYTGIIYLMHSSFSNLICTCNVHLVIRWYKDEADDRYHKNATPQDQTENWTIVINLCRYSNDEDTIQKRSADAKRYSQEIHGTSSHEELLSIRTVSVFEGDVDANCQWHGQREAKDQVVCPVELQVIICHCGGL